MSGFGWAEIFVGNPLIERLQFELVEFKGALEQKFDLAFPLGRAISDPYKSGFSLLVVLEATTIKL